MRTVEYQNHTVRLIDQTVLPDELRFVECSDGRSVAQAIRDMKVRGAPAIGVAAAFAIAMDADHYRGSQPHEFLGRLRELGDRLKAARDKEDVPGMKKILSELEEATQEIGKAIYEKAARTSGTGSAGGTAPEEGKTSEKGGDKPKGEKSSDDETIIDADYEVKD